MTCQEIIDFLMAYLDGELPSSQRRVFEEHIDECNCCEQFMASYRRTVSLARSCSEVQGPIKPPEALIKAILAARKANAD